MPTGSCFCQSLKYEYTGEPIGKAACHCLSCRKISGSTNTMNLLVPEANLRITSGTAKQHTQPHESGMHITVFFCEKCGGVIYKTADEEMFAGSVVVQVGTLDDEEDVVKAKPEVELYTKDRVPWLPGFEWAVQKVEF